MADLQQHAADLPVAALAKLDEEHGLLAGPLHDLETRVTGLAAGLVLLVQEDALLELGDLVVGDLARDGDLVALVDLVAGMGEAGRSWCRPCRGA
jgi:hypothetical protein